MKNYEKKPVQTPVGPQKRRIRLNLNHCEVCKIVGTVPGRKRDLCPWCAFGITYSSWEEKFEMPEELFY